MVVQRTALKAEMMAEMTAVNAEKIKIEVINLIVNMNGENCRCDKIASKRKAAGRKSRFTWPVGCNVG